MIPMEMPHNGLIVLDVDRRTYIGLSRDGTYYHMVQAATPEMAKAYDFVGADGLTVSPVAASDLVCSCPGGRFKHHCYRIDQAKEFERSIEEEARWGDLPSPFMADEPAAKLDADQPIPVSANTPEPVPA